MIYYEYGSLVLIYKLIDVATRSFNILLEATFDDKKLVVQILPKIQVCLTKVISIHFFLISTHHFFIRYGLTNEDRLLVSYI